MSYNFTNTAGRGRIFKCLRFNHDKLRPHRELRTRLIGLYAGSSYTNAKLKEPLALMLQAAEAHVLGIAANRPRVLKIPKKIENTEFAKHYQEAVNNLLEEIRIEQTLQSIALDSFFGPAFAKVYLGDSPTVMNEGDIWMDPGQAYVDRLSLDDFVYDTQAKDFRKCVMMADRYRLPLWMVKDDKTRFDPKVTKDLDANSSRGDDESTNAEYLSKDTDDPVKDGDYEPMVDLADVYLPRERKIITWVIEPGFVQRGDVKHLAVQDWDGAETGPYHYLNMGAVPDNILPTSPAQNLEWLAELANSLSRKGARQAQRQKTVTVAKSGAKDDAKKIGDAKDGEIVFLDDPEAVREMRLGGADNNLSAYLSGIIALYDRMGGNLRARAGLGASSDTVGQDQLIHANVTRSEAAMQAKMVRFTTEIVDALSLLMFDDPVKVIPGTLRIAGTSVELPDHWRPSIELGAREGRPEDYITVIVEGSMAYQSLNQRAQNIESGVMFLANVAQGLMVMQQLGVHGDFSELVDIVSEYRNTPELKRVFKTGRLPEPQQQSQSYRGQLDKPNGQYTRRSVSEDGGGESMEQAFGRMTPNEPQEQAA